MTSINTVDAKEEFSELINRVAHNKERIILTRRGHDIAAIIPIEDLSLLEENEDKKDLQEAIEAFKEARNQHLLTLEDLQAKG